MWWRGDTLFPIESFTRLDSILYLVVTVRGKKSYKDHLLAICPSFCLVVSL